jgi:hypothetical protein
MTRLYDCDLADSGLECAQADNLLGYCVILFLIEKLR